MNLSVITLTYNNLEYTRNFIESLYKNTKDFELIVVDNGSIDGTVDYLKNLKDIKVIYNKENQGYAKGNNQGVALAEGKYIAFLNNDILLYPNWFEECLSVFEAEPTAAFVSPREIKRGIHCVSEKLFRSYFALQKYQKAYEKSFSACSFSCVVTKKELFEKLGLFDEQFFPAFYEDEDLKLTAIENNYDLFVCNKACFYHYSSVTSKALDYNLNKNKDHFCEKHRIGAYFIANSQEVDLLLRQIKSFNRFPLNFLYVIYLLFEKVINRIKKEVNKF